MSSSINLQAPPTGSSPWRRHSTASLPEVFCSIPVPKSGSFWRKILAFAGPGFLASVGYMVQAIGRRASPVGHSSATTCFQSFSFQTWWRFSSNISASNQGW